ncbi:COG1721 Uncharacterized conserved protein (some members contain a von Willebrand factor type A (vWA) domain) [Methylophilaceae bacterium]
MLDKVWPLRFWKLGYWQQWFRVVNSANNVAILNPRQIYIIPTRWGLLYAIMLIGLLIGSINYSLSLGYYVTFLLASLGNIAMLHTWRNLVHLQVAVLNSKPVFASESVAINLKISESKNRPRYVIGAYFNQQSEVIHDINANDALTVEIPLATQKRGWQSLPRLTVYTEFPLSLLHAWVVIENPFQFLVYPKPSDSSNPNNLSADAITQGSSMVTKGDDDFNGHKNYQVGDSPSRIDWKASSRGIGMYTKLYSGAEVHTLWLDWADTSGSTESRISQLTRLVMDAHATQQIYGLRLPNNEIAANNSEEHYHQVLTDLALFK